MHRRWVVTLIGGMALGAPPLGAQAGRWQPLGLIGSDPDDRARLAQLRGLTGTSGYLLRSASTMDTQLPGDTARLRWALLLPQYTTVYNSALPFSLNDAALWAGRGWSHATSAGLRAVWKRVSLTLAPEFLVSENLAYELPPPGRRLPLPPNSRRCWACAQRPHVAHAPTLDVRLCSTTPAPLAASLNCIRTGRHACLLQNVRCILPSLLDREAGTIYPRDECERKKEMD